VGRLRDDEELRLSDGRAVLLSTARPRDARALAGLLDEVAAEPEVTLLLLPGQVGARVWRRRIAEAEADPRSLLLVARAGGGIVGNLGLHPDPHPCSAHVCQLGMSVAAGWRRLGVGGGLLRAALRWAAGEGYVKAALSVLPHNAAALRLYEKHGFARDGLRAAQFDRAGEYHDEVLMSRFLTGEA
jgi:putative acetyltransferase